MRLRKYWKLLKKQLSKPGISLLCFLVVSLSIFVIFVSFTGYKYNNLNVQNNNYSNQEENNFIKIIRVYSYNSILAKTPEGQQRIGLLGLDTISESELEMYSRLPGFPLSELKKYKEMVKQAKYKIKKMKKGDILYIEDFTIKHPLTNQRLYIIQLANKKNLNLELIKSGFFFSKA